MMPKPSIPEHLFVKNPYTGKLVNMLPLFELMGQNGRSFDGVEDLKLRLQEVHDFVSTHVPREQESETDLQTWADMSYTLIEFRKTFERMQEVPG